MTIHVNGGVCRDGHRKWRCHWGEKLRSWKDNLHHSWSHRNKRRKARSSLAQHLNHVMPWLPITSTNEPRSSDRTSCFKTPTRIFCTEQLSWLGNFRKCSSNPGFIMYFQPYDLTIHLPSLNPGSNHISSFWIRMFIFLFASQKGCEGSLHTTLPISVRGLPHRLPKFF